MTSKQLLDAAQVAERLNISPRLARKLMMDMHPVDVGAGGKNKFWRVRPSELDAWIERREKQPEYQPVTLQLIKPSRKPKAHPGFIQPINGKIPTRKQLREAQKR